MSFTAGRAARTPHPRGRFEVLLVGNGPYQNRGCEAIVRGTLEILRSQFGPNVTTNAGTYAAPAVVQAQCAAEDDRTINHFCLDGMRPRWSRVWFQMRWNRMFGTRLVAQHFPLQPYIRDTAVALEIGGDNYTLCRNNSRPERFILMDRFLQSRGVPVVLWGASVGPFDADPLFAERMYRHLRSLDGIFVRESASFDYLRAHHLNDNLYYVADPAFLLQPVTPRVEKIDFPLRHGTIGINLSPMVAFYRRSPVNLTDWTSFCAELIKSIAELNRPILLVPHVRSTALEDDDYRLLNSVREAIRYSVRAPLELVPDGLSAAELKWIISRCSVFAGARTHATIAALSAGIPTLSIAYSRKAWGISQDVYGHLDYCVDVADLTKECFRAKIASMLDSENELRTHLREVIPRFKAAALSAGMMLAKILMHRACPGAPRFSG